jgi:hypothetical protein
VSPAPDEAREEEERRRRAEERRRTATERVLRSWEEENAASDEFWAALTPSERFAAACEMGLEWEAWNGGPRVEPGLSRTVERIRRP